MGKLIGRIMQKNITLSIFDNDAQVNGKTVLIRNVKIERFYLRNGIWQNNNYFNEHDLQNLSIALNRYSKLDFDKKKGDNTNTNDKN